MARRSRVPAGYLTVPPGTSERDMRELRRRFQRTARRGEAVMVVPAGVEFHTPAPDPQAAFTLRAVLAAHTAATAHLTRLRADQALDAQKPTDARIEGSGLAVAGRMERRAKLIEQAEAREREVRAELAEAHARATGQAPPEDPVTVTGEPDQARRTAAAELEEARLVEDAARGKLVALRGGPATLHTARAQHLRKQGTWAAALLVLGTVTWTLGFPAIVPVVAFTLAVAVVVLMVANVDATNQRIKRVRQAIPDANAEHDAAFRRLVAAEAGAVAAGIELTPSTLDEDVERAERAPVSLAWDT